MRRSKNLLGFRSLFASASSASPPSNSPFRVVAGGGANGGGAAHGGGFYGSNGGIAATASSSSSTAAMMDHYWHAQNPVLSGSARVALVALLSLFALGNLYVANQTRTQQEGGGGVMGVFGAGSAPSTHHVRGVTMRESWITSASQPFVSFCESFNK
jgi:hypothetical protein